MKKGLFSPHLAVAFLLGIFANLIQIAGLRLFMGLFYGTELHFGLFLSLWLAAISLGGFIGGRWPFSATTLCTACAFSPVVILLGWHLAPHLFSQAGGVLLPLGPVAVFLGLLVFPAALPLGALIPVLVSSSSKTSLGPFYTWESTGSFLGGVVFSLIFQGKVSSGHLLCILPLLPLTARLLLVRSSGLLPKITLLLWPLLCLFAATPLVENLETGIWKKFHPGYALSLSEETPYQKVQIGTYENQSSMFLNGALGLSWPDLTGAEKRVHSFLSAVPSPESLLLIGTPPPDYLAEYLKYPALHIDIVDLDPTLQRIVAKQASPSSRVEWITDDPRRFLRTSTRQYDAIQIIPANPTTLVGNRLFTLEAFRDMRLRLKPHGVLALSVNGTENYIGPEMEQVLLPMYQTLRHELPGVFAVPGDPILFWATAERGGPASSPKVLGKRFRQRKIKSLSFRPMSFQRLLFSFRVEELAGWLEESKTAATATPVLNRDLHPVIFSRQLRLWDIFSKSNLGWVLEKFRQATFDRLIALISFLTLIFALIIRATSKSHTENRKLYIGGVAVSGGCGLLTEIVLILLYQNRHGALFQMAALFFGVYMLGLASGASRIKKSDNPSITTLRLIKGAQLTLAFLMVGLLYFPSWHGSVVIGLGIFLTAFLDGMEFPVVDYFLQKSGTNRSMSAGFLVWADNLGALAAGLFSGIWFLPILGLSQSLWLVAALLSGNFLLLLIGKNSTENAPL